MAELTEQWLDFEALTSGMVDCIYDADRIATQWSARLDDLGLAIDQFEEQTGMALLEDVSGFLQKSCEALRRVVQHIDSAESPSLVDKFATIMRDAGVSVERNPPTEEWVRAMETTLLSRCGPLLGNEAAAVEDVIAELGTEARFGTVERQQVVEQLARMQQAVCEFAEEARSLLDGMTARRVIEITRDIAGALKDACVVTIDITGPFTVPAPSVKVYWLAVKSTVTAGRRLARKGGRLRKWITQRRQQVVLNRIARASGDATTGKHSDVASAIEQIQTLIDKLTSLRAPEAMLSEADAHLEAVRKRAREIEDAAKKKRAALRDSLKSRKGHRKPEAGDGEEKP